MKRKRKEEKKREEISLLNFIREVVEITIDKHSDILKDARHQALQHSPEGGALRHEAAPPDCEDGCHRPLPAVREKKPVQGR